LGVWALQPDKLTRGAQLCIAEILHRWDLIRNRADCQHYRRHNAASLLSPASDNRDDELPIRFLASRLGIDPAEVPAQQHRLLA
jgi:hypothetical protein